MLEAILTLNALCFAGVIAVLFRLDRRVDALENRTSAGIDMIRRLAGTIRRVWERQRINTGATHEQG